MIRIDLIIVCLVAYFVQLSYSSEICNRLAGRDIISYKEASDCYTSIPLTKQDQIEQVDSLIKTLEWYVFLDISKYSPEPHVPSQMELIDRLEEIKGRNYPNAFSFHRDLVKLFQTNHDGHTTYSSKCFEQFMFRQPFPLMSVENDKGKPIFKVIPQLLIPPEHQKYWLDMGIDVMKYAGRVVNYISAWNTYSHLQDFADTDIGISRDPNTRLNLGLAHPIYYENQWGIANGMHAVTDFPYSKDGTFYYFGNYTQEENLLVPHLVTVNPDFKPGMDYYKQFCQSKPLSIMDHRMNNLPYMEVAKILKLKSDSDLPTLNGQRIGRGIDNPLIRRPYAHAYKVSRDVGVLAIPSFSSYDINGYYRQVQAALNELTGARKLILDLSNNGGGVVCMGYHLLDTLIPSYPPKRFSTDMKLTPLMKEMIKRSVNSGTFMDYQYWRKPDGSKFASLSEFLTENYYYRGRKTQPYSPPFIDYCPPNPLQHFKSFTNSTIVVVTNGICFSTCALVVNALQEFYQVRTYVVGDPSHHRSPAATLAGGSIFSLHTLQSHLQRTKLTNHPDAPKPLHFSAEFTFTIREAHSSLRRMTYIESGKPPVYSPQPLEFTWLPATRQIPNTEANFHDPSLVWRQIAEEF